MGKSSSKLGPVDELDNTRGPPSDEQIEKWVAAGDVVPCESAGPLVPKSYHSNLSGLFMGFKSRDVYDEWFESNQSSLAAYESWMDVNIFEVPADWAMTFGHYAMGSVFPYYRMKVTLEKERQSTFESYRTAAATLGEAEPEVYAALTADGEKYATRGTGTGVRHDQGCEDIRDLYEKAISALPALWKIAQRMATAGGSSDLAWSVKKLLRLQKKIVEKGYGHPSGVTDVARVSVVFANLASLQKGLDAVLGGEPSSGVEAFEVVTLKNRFAAGPILEESRTGYNDFLLKVRVRGHIGEIQCHVQALYAIYCEKGPNLSRWFSRLLQRDDVYEGEKNEAGEFHGQGKMSFASGDVYEGSWSQGEMHGEGTMKFSNSNDGSYVGEWKIGKFDGKGVLTMASGNRYEGDFKEGKQDGHGTLIYARGQRKQFEGEWEAGVRSGFGTMTYANGEQEEGEYEDGKLAVDTAPESTCGVS
jgi:hypothetical protein